MNLLNYTLSHNSPVAEWNVDWRDDWEGLAKVIEESPLYNSETVARIIDVFPKVCDDLRSEISKARVAIWYRKKPEISPSFWNKPGNRRVVCRYLEILEPNVLRTVKLAEIEIKDSIKNNLEPGWGLLFFHIEQNICQFCFCILRLLQGSRAVLAPPCLSKDSIREHAAPRDPIVKHTDAKISLLSDVKDLQRGFNVRRDKQQVILSVALALLCKDYAMEWNGIRPSLGNISAKTLDDKGRKISKTTIGNCFATHFNGQREPLSTTHDDQMPNLIKRLSNLVMKLDRN